MKKQSLLFVNLLILSRLAFAAQSHAYECTGKNLDEKGTIKQYEFSDIQFTLKNKADVSFSMLINGDKIYGFSHYNKVKNKQKTNEDQSSPLHMRKFCFSKTPLTDCDFKTMLTPNEGVIRFTFEQDGPESTLLSILSNTDHFHVACDIPSPQN